MIMLDGKSLPFLRQAIIEFSSDDSSKILSSDLKGDTVSSILDFAFHAEFHTFVGAPK